MAVTCSVVTDTFTQLYTTLDRSVHEAFVTNVCPILTHRLNFRMSTTIGQAFYQACEQAFEETARRSQNR